jgi:heme-degrading monooxygenase HmoA
VIAVIFEVRVAEGRRQEYLDLAADLRGELVTLDGLLSVERFQSLSDPGKLLSLSLFRDEDLSLSFFRDEDMVRRWRRAIAHRQAQIRGHAGIFADYRLRIAHVMRDYGMTDRSQAPADGRTAHTQAAPPQ